MDKADVIFNEAFGKPRDQRSPEYKDGVRAGIIRGLGQPAPFMPHLPGTAAADAWYAGWDEGLRRGMEASRG